MEPNQVQKFQPTVAVDLDNTLTEMPVPYRPNVIGPTISTAKKSLFDIKRRGFRIVVYTARPVIYREFIEKTLKERGLPIDEVVCGKPCAIYYIDDRAIRFQGGWMATMLQFNSLEKIRTGDLDARWDKPKK